jgi:hypothetical protein
MPGFEHQSDDLRCGGLWEVLCLAERLRQGSQRREGRFAVPRVSSPVGLIRSWPRLREDGGVTTEHRSPKLES